MISRSGIMSLCFTARAALDASTQRSIRTAILQKLSEAGFSERLDYLQQFIEIEDLVFQPQVAVHLNPKVWEYLGTALMNIKVLPAPKCYAEDHNVFAVGTRAYCLACGARYINYQGIWMATGKQISNGPLSKLRENADPFIPTVLTYLAGAW